MEKITLKAYALKHKLSLFNVVKMVKSGEMLSETVKENDKDVLYIVVDETIKTGSENVEVKEKMNESYRLKKENLRLKQEIIELQAKIAALKN